MDNFMPHGFCMMWNKQLVLLHVLSDVLIALAYFSIPLGLLVFVRRRRDLQFGFLFWLFSAFIFACGLTHVTGAVTLWLPDYWIEGWLKALTAVISVATAVVLWLTIPKALRIPSPAQMERANADLREAHTRALALAERATASDRAKDEFLAVMSHELRTPMNAILGFADLLTRGRLDPTESEHVETIRQSGGALLRIIDDVLDMSSLAAGGVAIEPAPMQPGTIAVEVAWFLRPMAAERNIALETDLDPALPAWIQGDRGRIRQILVNLAGNAIKHGGATRVTIAARCGPGPAGAGFASVDYRVADNGSGIRPEDIAAIFEPFRQLDGGLNRRRAGTGLGLSISQRLATVMGGSLTCESTVGVGSTFIFRSSYPLVSAPAPGCVPVAGEEPSLLSTGPALRLLLAEDDPTNRKLIVLMLKNLGCTPAVATNGVEALDLYRRETIDCVLMDVQMPEMDGIAATAAMRALEAAESHRPAAYIIAVTADVLPRDRERCLAAGMNELLAKPLKTAALAAALERARQAAFSLPA